MEKSQKYILDSTQNQKTARTVSIASEAPVWREIMGLAESRSKTCCLSNNYCGCAYKLTPVIMSACSWDVKWNLLLHTSLFKQIHGQGKKQAEGQRRCQCVVCVCYRYMKMQSCI